jgi:hypothetical protein
MSWKSKNRQYYLRPYTNKKKSFIIISIIYYTNKIENKTKKRNENKNENENENENRIICHSSSSALYFLKFNIITEFAYLGN